MKPCPSCLARGEEAEARKLWALADVPPKHADCRFETYDVHLFPDDFLRDGKRHPVAGRTQRAAATEAVSETRRWASGEGEPFLMLLSPPGTGKTHLAVAAIYRLTRARKVCLYLPGGILAAKARSGDREGLQPFFEHIQTVQVLVLDDVGAEYDSEYLRSVYHGIIDTRYRNPELRTLVISNHSEAELTVRLGPRVIDRLVEKATGIAVVIEAESVRERRPT